MKTFITIISILISLICIGQSNQQLYEKWNLGLNISIDHNLYNPITNMVFSNQSGIADFRRTKYNFSAGIDNQFNFSNRLALVVGVTYSEMSVEGTYYCYSCDFSMAPLHQTFRLSYIQTPLYFRYFIYRNTIGVHFDGGFSGSYSINRFTLQNFVFDSRLGLGINHSLGNVKMNYTIVYSNSLAIISEYTDYKLRSVGLLVGLIF